MATRTVPSSEYPTLQAAFDAAANGDTISVLRTYTGSLSAIGNQTLLTLRAPAKVKGLDIDLFGDLDHSFTFIGAGTVDVTTGSGKDTLIGDSGNDTLRGGAGDDTLHGGAGNDTLYSGSGDNTLHADDGDDYVYVGDGSHILNGGAGSDWVNYEAGPQGVTVDLQTGTAINSWGHTDTLSSIENIVGSAQANRLTGNSATNRLFGGTGDDTLIGGDGDDYLGGGLSGRNLFLGGKGNDTLAPGDGIDTVNYLEDTGTQGVRVDLETGVATDNWGYTDTFANRGSLNYRFEILIGSSLHDDLIGNSLANTLIGNAGDDDLKGGNGADTLNGGDGYDSADYSGTGTQGVVVNLATDTAIDNWGYSDTLISIERIGGSDLADVLTGDDANNDIIGGGGNDTIFGGGGNDFLNGYDGDDSIDGGSGDDYLIGELGRDSLAGGTGHDWLYGGDDNDTMQGGTGNDTLTGGFGNDTLVGGDGSDTANYGEGNKRKVGATVDLAAGTASDGWGFIDTLSSIENVVGTFRADLIAGDGGNNILTGGAGNDSLAGGDGIDTVDYRDDYYMENNATGTQGAIVNLAGGTATDNWGNTDTLSGIENVVGSAMADKLKGDGGMNRLSGGAGNDTLNGGAGDDVLDGGLGADDMGGGLGSDLYIVDNLGDVAAESNGDGAIDTVQASVSHTLSANVENLSLTGTNAINGTGNARSNVLTGNDAANILAGKGGADALTGGGGADTFMFDTPLVAGTVTTITDFVHGVDTIALSLSVFSKAASRAGTLPPKSFAIGSEATAGADRIIYNSATGDLIYDPDGNRSQPGTVFATLSPGLDLTNTDFTLV